MRRNKTAFLWMCMAIVVGITGQAIAEQAKEITCTGKVVDEQGKPIAGARITGQAIAEQAKEIICTGKVVDEQGKPIAGARLALYQVTYDYAVNTAESQLSGEVTSSKVTATQMDT